jgi:hypothetical protein
MVQLLGLELLKVLDLVLNVYQILVKYSIDFTVTLFSIFLSEPVHDLF